MENKFTIGTFYTIDTPYEQVFKDYLLPSVMNLFYEYEVKWKVSAIENKGSWNKNVAQKPLVILKMLEEMNNIYNNDKALVFLDADSSVDKYPRLFNEIPNDVDIALHYLDWATWYQNGINRKELLTGTMFFRNNQKVRDLVKEWYEQALKTDVWEQQVLERLLPKTDLVVYELPVEYCYIKSMPNGSAPHVKCEPVISHNQVSRKLKRVING